MTKKKTPAPATAPPPLRRSTEYPLPPAPQGENGSGRPQLKDVKGLTP